MVSGEHRKVIYKHLKNWYLPNKVDEQQVRHSSLLMDKVFSSGSFPDGHAKRFLSKFRADFTKKYNKALSEEDFRTFEHYREDIGFLDDLFCEPGRGLGERRLKQDSRILEAQSDDISNVIVNDSELIESRTSIAFEAGISHDEGDSEGNSVEEVAGILDDTHL
ncbi:hypothetical protein D9757_004205 [Collybiopsis confluens]|uniref:Uncharacterized protein n=1 Tax=Collybiopsis confluens TaxID=2823264 RepID=A0A8H5MD53_9AGAR|nr:hypothetical protein D9757_004205 [Collybiopsis confluens]